EVQLLANQYGNAISLFGRDCSVQRWHQNIIEEAPVTITKENMFEQMEHAAVRLAKLVGYVSAGTVEYLHSRGEDLYFLELNPHLQVEHPTTDMVSGVNLLAAQLQVAMGIPLCRIRHIRTLFGVAPNGSSSIDFDMVKPESNQLQRKLHPKGFFISNKLTAKHPDVTLAVVCGAIMKAHLAADACISKYKRILDRGQVPACDLLKTVFDADFIYENMRYNFTCARSSKNVDTCLEWRPDYGGLLILLRQSELSCVLERGSRRTASHDRCENAFDRAGE
ncbi:hypothetical protein DFH29DRAFT_815071, partial [Suillus ampliporus]